MDDLLLLLFLVPIVLLVLSVAAVVLAARALGRTRQLEVAMLGLQAELARRAAGSPAGATPRPWEAAARTATQAGSEEGPRAAGAFAAAELPVETPAPREGAMPEEAGAVSPGTAPETTGTVPDAGTVVAGVPGAIPAMDGEQDRPTGATAGQPPAPPGTEPVRGPFPAPPRRGLEEAILLRWGVWLGAAALALAAVFLVRTALDEGWLGPEARCVLAALGGLALVAGAEWLARRPAKGALPDFAPAGLAAGGVATFFAAGYAATALYGLLGPIAGFVAMAAAGIAGILLSLRFGPAVAVVGLAGAFVTPMLVGGESGSLPALFGYLLVVIAAATVVVRRTAWVWLGWFAVAGGAFWVVVGNAVAMGESGGIVPDGWAPALFVPAAAALHLWGLPGVALDRTLGRRLSVVPVLALGLAGGLYAVDTASAWPAASTLLLAAVTIGRGAQEPRLILAPVTGAALGLLLLGWWALPWPGSIQPLPEAVIEPVLPMPVIAEALQSYVTAAAILAAMFLLAGAWMEGRAAGAAVARGGMADGPAEAGRDGAVPAGAETAAVAGATLGNGARPAGAAPVEAVKSGPVPSEAVPAGAAPIGTGPAAMTPAGVGVVWAGLAAAVPLLVMLIAYARIGGFVLDGRWALGVLALAAVSVGLAARSMRAGREAAAGAHAAAAVGAVALGCAMILRDQWLSIAVALTLPPLAIIARRTGLQALRRVASVVAAVVLVRLLLNPSVLDYALGGQVVFNALLPAYGLPAVAMLLAAWLFRRERDDGDVALLEAGGAALLAALVLMEIHHGFDPGFWMDETAFSFREMASHAAALSVMALAALLVSRRTGRVVAGWAWRLLGGAALVLEAGLLLFNPGVTGEAVGPLSVFNALLPAFLVPALAAALALRARETAHPPLLRPVLGVLVLLAVLAWSTLEIRHAFHGDALDLFSGYVPVDQAELWVWSGAWAALGVLALLAGLRRNLPALRWVGLGLVALVVAKAFLVDIGALGGLWRVLSFLGLGLVLIGLGAVYRRLLPGVRGTDGEAG